MERMIGISLGSANASAAILEGGRPFMITNADGQIMTPCSFPSLLSSCGAEEQAFELHAEKTLSSLVRAAGQFLAEPVTGAVIAVPNTWYMRQRIALSGAAKRAGLTRVSFLHDTSAAALALSFYQHGGKTLIYDFGASHTGVSVAVIGNGMADILSVRGDSAIRGDLFAADDLSAGALAHLKQLTEEALRDADYDPDPLEHVILTGGYAGIPSVQQAVRSVLGDGLPIRIFPRTITAEGAAVLAAVRSGEVKDQLLLDATSHVIGIKTEGNTLTPMIDRNTTIPAASTQLFSTSADNQSVLDLYILEGDGKTAEKSVELFHEHISHIPPAQRGVPRIEVKIDIDANGIPTVRSRILPNAAADAGRSAGSGDRQAPEKPAARPARKEVNPAVRKMIDDLLPTIDNLDQAIRNTPDKAVAEGMGQTVRGLLEKMKEWGAEEIPAAGMRFDPHFHEAVMVVPGEADDMVTEVVRRGFRLDGKVIRYAQVIVSRKK